LRRVGLIGGTSWESTLAYYRLLNARSNAMLGGLHTVEILLCSMNFGQVRSLVDGGRLDELRSLWRTATQTLLEGGAGLVAVCSNAGHARVEWIEDLLRDASVPLVHIVDATAQAVQRAAAGEAGRVGILGTRETMRSDGYYVRRLADRWQMQALLPTAPEQDQLQRIIFDEIARGFLDPASRARVLAIAERLVADGATAVVLACTELPLLVATEDAPAPMFDTLSLHVDEILRRATEGEAA